ncbi:hypothetical protein BDV29DRAFT_159100 [Aspergillus leporis]|uniref:Uncharacterized protein n=1 Tax=Aspergillus leporis TaxID=41062 RepID=A0A5N5WU36_9EURO|nr:hypothetical protein BDV29DRAFT_159100 [Aspergillus leporis]
MKPTSVLVALFSLVSVAVADKTCTPSFDYCASELTIKKGFTENDLKTVLKGTEFEKEDLKDILFHCKNPGDVGHPKATFLSRPSAPGFLILDSHLRALRASEIGNQSDLSDLRDFVKATYQNKTMGLAA